MDVPDDAPPPAKDDAPAAKEDDKKGGKRKRGFSEEDAALVSGVTDAIWGLNHAVSEGNHSEAAPGIADAVLNLPNFSRTERMKCLKYLMEHKASALVFVGMEPADQELWCQLHLEE